MRVPVRIGGFRAIRFGKLGYCDLQTVIESRASLTTATDTDWKMEVGTPLLPAYCIFATLPLSFGGSILHRMLATATMD